MKSRFLLGLAALLASTLAFADTTLIVQDLVTVTTTSGSKQDTRTQSATKSPSTSKYATTKGLTGSSGGTTTQQVPLSILSSQYQAGSPASGGRSSSANAQSYVITRTMDEHSSVIQDAADRGRAFNAAVISSGSSTIRLDNVVLSSYTTSMGGGQSTETFKVHFQTRNVN
jgi:hypothetical protein